MAEIQPTDPIVREPEPNPDPTFCPTCLSGFPPPDKEYDKAIEDRAAG